MKAKDGPKTGEDITNTYHGTGEVVPVQNLGAEQQDAPRADSLQALVWASRAGDNEARERLIGSYQPFIIKIAAAVSRRYLRPGLDDEISVAMLGFNEAINCFNLSGKVPFLTFAEIVIRRRLVDYFRKQAARSHEIPLSSLEVEGEEERENIRLPGLVREAEAAHARTEEAVERREEILRYRTILAEFGLNFPALTKVTPKHADTRKRMIQVSRTVATNERLLALIKSRKALPVVEIAMLSGLSRKTIERHRKYIMAVVLVLANDLPTLQAYLGA